MDGLPEGSEPRPTYVNAAHALEPELASLTREGILDCTFEHHQQVRGTAPTQPRDGPQPTEQGVPAAHESATGGYPMTQADHRGHCWRAGPIPTAVSRSRRQRLWPRGRAPHQRAGLGATGYRSSQFNAVAATNSSGRWLGRGVLPDRRIRRSMAFARLAGCHVRGASR